ncbi:MAG: type 4a pilus biogenesis protein PilO [Polyangiaceae bacterium]
MATKPSTTPGGSSLDRAPPVAKAGVGVLFMVLFAALYFVMFYGDLETEIAGEQQREANLMDDLAKAKSSKEAYQRDLDEKARREQQAREYKKILPDESETPAFLSALQNAATISGVNLTSWSPTDEVGAQFYSKVPMKLTLAGKFHQVAKFFHSVGQLDRIINVENIHIKVKPDVTTVVENNVDVECLATAFRASTGPVSGRGRKP